MTGQELKAIRDHHGLTQQALGVLLGYHTNYISRLERGEEPITPRFERLVTTVLRHKKPHRPSQSSHD